LDTLALSRAGTVRVSVADKARKAWRTRKTRDIALSGSKRATIGLGQKKRINYRSRATNRTIIAKFRAPLRAADFHEISAKRVRPALKHVASQVRAITNPGVGKVLHRRGLETGQAVSRPDVAATRLDFIARANCRSLMSQSFN